MLDLPLILLHAARFGGYKSGERGGADMRRQCPSAKSDLPGDARWAEIQSGLWTFFDWILVTPGMQLLLPWSFSICACDNTY